MPRLDLHRAAREAIDRRRLAAAARAAIADPAPAALPRPDRPVRVALLGAGRHGAAKILPALEASPDATVARIVVRSAARAAQLAGRHAGRVSTDLEAALAPGDADLDAAVVALPPALLAAGAALARARGLHVLCDTPGAVTEADIALLEASGRDPTRPHRAATVERPAASLDPGDRPLLVFTSPVRFTPAFTSLRERLQERGATAEAECHSLFHLCDLAVMCLGPAVRVLRVGADDVFDVASPDGRRLRLRMRPGTSPWPAAAEGPHRAAIAAFLAAVRSGDPGPLPGLGEIAPAVRLADRIRWMRRGARIGAFLRRFRP